MPRKKKITDPEEAKQREAKQILEWIELQRKMRFGVKRLHLPFVSLYEGSKYIPKGITKLTGTERVGFFWNKLLNLQEKLKELLGEEIYKEVTKIEYELKDYTSPLTSLKLKVPKRNKKIKKLVNKVLEDKNKVEKIKQTINDDFVKKVTLFICRLGYEAGKWHIHNQQEELEIYYSEIKPLVANTSKAMFFVRRIIGLSNQDKE